jgi:hypothetical protein
MIKTYPLVRAACAVIWPTSSEYPFSFGDTFSAGVAFIYLAVYFIFFLPVFVITAKRRAWHDYWVSGPVDPIPLFDNRPDLLMRGELKHPDPLIRKAKYTRDELFTFKWRPGGIYSMMGFNFRWSGEPRQLKISNSLGYSTVYSVSVELLAQLVIYSNTMPVLDEETACDRINYSARNLTGVNTSRWDFLGCEQVIANTVHLVYGLYKQTREQTRHLPFYRAPVKKQ